MHTTIVKVYVTDVRAFCDDHEIREWLDGAQNTLGERGRILLRLPSAEPIVRVLIEVDDADLCRSVRDAFLDVLHQKGYEILS